MDEKENLEAGDDDARVLPGGSCVNLRSNVRCAYRLNFKPFTRDRNVGFCILVSPIFPTSPLRIPGSPASGGKANERQFADSRFWIADFAIRRIAAAKTGGVENGGIEAPEKHYIMAPKESLIFHEI